MMKLGGSLTRQDERKSALSSVHVCGRVASSARKRPFPMCTGLGRVPDTASRQEHVGRISLTQPTFPARAHGQAR